MNTQTRIHHDREARRNCNDEYQQSVFRRDVELHELKGIYGNINNDFDIDGIIMSNRASIFKMLFKGKRAKARRLKEINILMKQIKESRSINKKGGLVWL